MFPIGVLCEEEIGKRQAKVGERGHRIVALFRPSTEVSEEKYPTNTMI